MAGKVSWLALNVGDHSASSWSVVVQRSAQYRIKVIPWARLCHGWEGLPTALQKFQKMKAAADLWGTDWILPNYEDEAEKGLPPHLALEAFSLSGWKKNVGWSTQGWLPNSVDYLDIYKDPVLLQIFPTDMRKPPPVKLLTTDCIKHARGLDESIHRFTYVGVTYQTYGEAKPWWYDLSGVHSIYHGDGLESKWAIWFP